MKEWILWLGIVGGTGEALEIARHESKEQCEIAQKNLVYAVSEASGGNLPKKLAHGCFETEKRR